MFDPIDLPQEIRLAVLAAYRARPAFYDRAAKTAYQGDAPDYPILKRTPLERLTILCRCREDFEERYRELGIPEKIVGDTLADISRRAAIYHRKTGKTGLSREDALWSRHLAHRELFQIGSLQFQPFSMIYLDEEGCGEEYMTFSREKKKLLPPGSPVINVHVPADVDLSPKAVADPLNEAVGFFKRSFPDRGDTHFLCYSWLLYPDMEPLLPEKSNIRSFASRFQILGKAADPSDAVKAIYGRRFPRKKDYPQTTSLQKNALGNFSKLGIACGILPMDALSEGRERQ